MKRPLVEDREKNNRLHPPFRRNTREKKKAPVTRHAGKQYLDKRRLEKGPDLYVCMCDNVCGIYIHVLH